MGKNAEIQIEPLPGRDLVNICRAADYNRLYGRQDAAPRFLTTLCLCFGCESRWLFIPWDCFMRCWRLLAALRD
jgi:hypothetical protein